MLSLTNITFYKYIQKNITSKVKQKIKTSLLVRPVSYVQGQELEPRIREYFYYIDHQGMLFLDDSKMKNFTSCFKEKKFLQFFFKNLKINNTGKYMEDFPYISPCGKERNYIRCDDYPIVYTHIVQKVTEGKKINLVAYGHVGDLLVTEFLPNKIYMLPETGRVYHPANEKFGSIGLIRSNLSIELSKYFEFHNGEHNPPTHFTWDEVQHELDQNWFKKAVNK